MTSATSYLLPSTKDSKYAHAPAWTVRGFGAGDSLRPACYQEMPNLDLDFPDLNKPAFGKPPCPKCIEQIRRHIERITEFLDSYRHLIWVGDADTQR